ncbi:kinase-like protein [Athelia psychrophila]|uniref:Kinase-like protein n=1 Tax=Athelia psychrophila TaxID=1759441 RepID=A0A166I2D0_9AGAM|nr:kinase-like protein [Fibularhizoctonia sp. CBS 109695]
MLSAITHEFLCVQRLNRELRVWQRLKHKNVLLLYGTVASFGPCLSFVSPWLKNGSISNYVKTWGGDLGMANRLQLVSKTFLNTISMLLISLKLCEVAAGLSYLHQSGVVHGDLTGANILIADDCSACLCDFGLSSIAAEFLGTSESFIPDNIRWAAPELYHVPKDGAVPMVSTHSDVYSYGSVAFEILSGRIPFEYLRDAQVIRQVFQGKKTPRPPSQNAPYVTDQLWAFMNQCWVEPPPDRPDVEQLLQSMQRFLGEID